MINKSFHNLDYDTCIYDVFYTFLIDAPILLSFPHFLYADDEYQHSVKGVKPSIDKHRTYVHLEPVSILFTLFFVKSTTCM